MLGRIAKVFFIGIAVSLLTAAFVAAQTPTTISYQGRLTNATGQPITTATSVTFAIYSVPSGGTALYTSTQSVTPDANGIFTVELGPFGASVFDGSKRYLGIKAGADAEMTPRQLLTSAPYAFNTTNIPDNSVTSAKIASGAVGNSALANNAVTSTKISDGTITNSDVSASAAIAISKISGASGVEYNAIGDHLGLTTALSNLGSVTLSCPTSGYVIVMLTGSAVFFGDNTTADIGIGTSTSSFAYSVGIGRLDGAGTARFYQAYSAIYTTSVVAGNRTFYALGQKSTVFSANSINLTDLYLTAIFVPNRY